MKLTKRMVSFALVLALVLVLSAGVFAADANSITVKDAKGGETYNIYKMLDLVASEDATAFSYTVNENWTDFFTGSGAGAAYVVIDQQGYVSWNQDKADASSMEAFGKLAAAFAAEKSVPTAAAAITPEAEDKTDITFTALASGYYLITSTNGTLAMVDTTPTKPAAEVQEKNVDPSLDKEVLENGGAFGGGNVYGKDNDAQIGDTITFQLTINAYKGAKSYVVHDTMSEGLTFVKDSVVVASVQNISLIKDLDYTVVTEGLTDGCTFEIRFSETALDSIAQHTRLIVTYEAVLNEKASVENGETNQASLTWGNNGKSTSSKTETKTYQFSVLKYATGNEQKTPLAGATFQLLDARHEIVKLVKVDETTYRVANGDEAGAQETFTTVSEGPTLIKGVDNSDYSLKEITAPSGYNLLADEVMVMVDGNNELVVEVQNSTGTELPSTGGMGTTIFYVLGAALVLGAVVVLVTRKRMGKNN